MRKRLDQLGWYSLEFRRMRGDFIETYKILMGLERLDAGRMFPMLGKSRTGGHSLRIRGKPFRTEMRKNFFTQSCEPVEFSITESCWGQFVRYVQEGAGRGPCIKRDQEIWRESRSGILKVHDQP